MSLFKQLFSKTNHLSGIGLNIYAIGQKKLLICYFLHVFAPHWRAPYRNLQLLKGMDYGKFRWPESLHDKDYTGDTQPANVLIVCPFFL